MTTAAPPTDTEQAEPAPPEPEPAVVAERAEKRVSTEIVPLKAGESAISLQPGQSWWSDRQRTTLLATKFPSDQQPSNENLMAFLHICLVTELDPFRNEIYYIGRKDRKAPGGVKYTAQTGIDGFRHIAERTNEYDGRVSTEWCGPDGVWRDVWLDPSTPPAAARVAVKRRGVAHPFYGVCAYAEFVPLKEVWEGSGNNSRKKLDADGKVLTEPMGLWPKMPAHMLAKCAEAQAIRAAFPRQAGGVYLAEEMHQADAREANDARAARRDAVAERSWARHNGVEIGGPAIEVVDTVVVLPARESILEELANQARIMGGTLNAWCRRWVAAHKKNVEDGTDAELWELAQSRRDLVAEKAREQDVEPYLATVPAETPDAAPVAAQDAPTEPAAPESTPAPEEGAEAASADEEPVVVEDPPGDGEQGALLDVPAPAARHPFYGGGDGESDVCLESGCGQYADADIHDA